MSQLPHGWILAPIADLTVECPQEVPASDETFIYIDIGSIDRETKKIRSPQTLRGTDAPSRARNRVRTGDVLVSMTRPGLNAVALVSPEYDGQVASTGFDVLRAPALDPRWLFYVVRSPAFIERMAALVQGALYPAVRPRDVRSFVASVAPFAQQRRIADKLDGMFEQLDSCRARLGRIPGILQRFRQMVLMAATSGALTKAWAARAGAAAWPVVALESVADDFSYGSSAKSAETGDVPVLRMGNIQDGQLDWDDLVYTSNLAEIDKYRLRDGDVLFNRTNSPELVGKTAVFRGDRPAIYAGYLIRVRCSKRLIPEYLAYCLNSPAGRDYCQRVKADGVSQSNINARKLAAFTFSLPPLAEQVEIVHRTEALLTLSDRLLQRGQACLLQVERVSPVLLSQALRGDLVSQGADDEPADALLARTHALRQQTPKRPRAVKKEKPAMASDDVEVVKTAILAVEGSKLSFEQIRASVPADYDTLKEALFALLREGRRLRQEFDANAREIRFVRVEAP